MRIVKTATQVKKIPVACSSRVRPTVTVSANPAAPAVIAPARPSAPCRATVREVRPAVSVADCGAGELTTGSQPAAPPVQPALQAVDVEHPARDGDREVGPLLGGRQA